MKRVPMAEFKDRVAQYVSEAEAGDEIVITRHGREAARLVPPSNDKLTKQREAVTRLFAVGDGLRMRYGAVPPEQIRSWIEEDRR